MKEEKSLEDILDSETLKSQFEKLAKKYIDASQDTLNRFGEGVYITKGKHLFQSIGTKSDVIFMLLNDCSKPILDNQHAIAQLQVSAKDEYEVVGSYFDANTKPKTSENEATEARAKIIATFVYQLKIIEAVAPDHFQSILKDPQAFQYSSSLYAKDILSNSMKLNNGYDQFSHSFYSKHTEFGKNWPQRPPSLIGRSVIGAPNKNEANFPATAKEGKLAIEPLVQLRPTSHTETPQFEGAPEVREIGTIANYIAQIDTHPAIEQLAQVEQTSYREANQVVEESNTGGKRNSQTANQMSSSEAQVDVTTTQPLALTISSRNLHSQPSFASEAMPFTASQLELLPPYIFKTMDSSRKKYFLKATPPSEIAKLSNSVMRRIINNGIELSPEQIQAIDISKQLEGITLPPSFEHHFTQTQIEARDSSQKSDSLKPIKGLKP